MSTSDSGATSGCIPPMNVTTETTSTATTTTTTTTPSRRSNDDKNRNNMDTSLLIKKDYILKERHPTLAVPPPSSERNTAGDDSRNNNDSRGDGNRRNRHKENIRNMMGHGGDVDNLREGSNKRGKKRGRGGRGKGRGRGRNNNDGGGDDNGGGGGVGRSMQPKICKSTLLGKTCPYGDSCKYEHDVMSLLASREDDIDTVVDGCPHYNMRGTCPFGMSCRLGSIHIDKSTGENLTKSPLPTITTPYPETYNILSKDVQTLLRKKKYNFSPDTMIEVNKRIENQENAKKLEETKNVAKKMLEEESTIVPDVSVINVAPGIEDVDGEPKKEDDISLLSLPRSVPTELPAIDPSASISTLASASATATVTASASASTSIATVTATTTATATASVSYDAMTTTTIISPTSGGDTDRVKGTSINDNTVTHTLPPSLPTTSTFIENNNLSTPLPSRTRRLIDFSNKVYVAPLTTVGNLPFRRIMKRYGADITCGEMATAFNLLEGKAGEWALLKRHPEEDIFGVQIAAGHGDMLTKVAEIIENECKVDFVDLNMGCPIDVICDRGAGAKLMLREKKLKQGLIGMSRVLSCPFTVKMRTGWNESHPFAHKLIPKIQSWGIDGLSAIMIHGRSRLQRYTKLADWDYIQEIAELNDANLPKIPLIGNGDILSYIDYEEKVECRRRDDGNEGDISATAMLGRGALIKPWLPTEIKERRHWDISASERLDILKDFVRFGLEHWGSDQQGVNNTRRFLLEWLSFLYRYVPVGLLETVPQRMNQRPPVHICGRSDLETLMLSKNCADWVKISEMLLGPVPDGFLFQPKHKANSYQ